MHYARYTADADEASSTSSEDEGWEKCFVYLAHLVTIVTNMVCILEV